MPASVGFLVVDSVDPEALAPFWCALLGVEISGRFDDGRYVILSATDGGLRITFQRVPEAKSGKNRLHLDLDVEDLDAVTAEVERLGGRWTEPGTTRDVAGFRWRCMADPEDNEFDLVFNGST